MSGPSNIRCFIGRRTAGRRGTHCRRANVLCVLSLLLYALSFFLPTFYVFKGGRSASYGYEAFMIGLMSSFASPYFGGVRVFAPWLANPLLWIGVIGFVRGHFRRAVILGVVATIAAATLLVGQGDRSFLLNGYLLWLLSMGMFTLAA